MKASSVRFSQPAAPYEGLAIETFRSDMLQSIAAGVMEKVRSREVDRAMAQRDACNRSVLRQRTDAQGKLHRERFSHSAALRRYAARLQHERTSLAS